MSGFARSRFVNGFARSGRFVSGPARSGRFVNGFARAALATLAAVVVGLAIAACGGSSTTTTNANTPAPPTTLDIYSSLPLHGPSAADAQAIVDGIRVALWQHHGRAGSWQIRYIALDDSSPATGMWDVDRTVANAHQAASDPAAVLYLGEFDSPASTISIPILNQAGVAQISPSNSYGGLTTREPDEPALSYPTGQRTFFRLMPRDAVSVAAALLAMQRADCTRVAVASDSPVWPALLQARAGIDVAATAAIGESAAAQRSLVAEFRARAIDCLYVAAQPSLAAVALARAVHGSAPAARLFGSDSVCTAAFTSQLGAATASQYQCTLMPMKLSAYPGYGAFASAFAARYGGAPSDPYAIYGYEAMSLGLSTLAQLGSQADNRSAVVTALHAMPARQSVLGSYRFTARGDTTLTAYGLYGVGADGQPSYERTLTPPAVGGL